MTRRPPRPALLPYTTLFQSMKRRDARTPVGRSQTLPGQKPTEMGLPLASSVPEKSDLLGVLASWRLFLRRDVFGGRPTRAANRERAPALMRSQMMKRRDART